MTGAGCTSCPQLRLSEPLSVGQTHLLQSVEGTPVHPGLPSPVLNENPPCVSATSLERLPSLPLRGLSLSFQLLRTSWHSPGTWSTLSCHRAPTAHGRDARTPKSALPQAGTWAEDEEALLKLGGGGPHSHPPSLKLDAAGEADREINWAFSKTRRWGENHMSAACLPAPLSPLPSRRQLEPADPWCPRLSGLSWPCCRWPRRYRAQVR